MNAKLAFIAAQMTDHAVRLMCRVLGVSRSRFYAWRCTAPKRAARGAKWDALVDEIRAVFETSKQRYGAPRIHAELQAQGHHVSRKVIAKLMKQNGMVKAAAACNHRQAPFLCDRAQPSSRRNFKIMVPDTVWLADISYIPTDEGWLYLASVKDLGTMEIVGWSMSERLKRTLCEDAPKMAIRNRGPPRALIVYTDTGVQYACASYRKLLGLHGIKASMSRKGNCLEFKLVRAADQMVRGII